MNEVSSNKNGLKFHGKYLPTLIFIIFGILINHFGAQLMLLWEIPLFFDSIGTVFCSAVGGFFPGIAVGFISNIINGLSDTITLYYGIVSIMIATATVLLTRKGMFVSLKKALIGAVVLSVFGGGIGSLITWIIYGFQFGSGFSAPFSIYIYNLTGMHKFWAQFIADMGIDVFDKLLTVLIVFFAIRLIPSSLLSNTYQGAFLYIKDRADDNYSDKHPRPFLPDIKHSLRLKVICLIIISTMFLGTTATYIGFVIYKDSMYKKYIDICDTAAAVVKHMINPDKINYYLKYGSDESYLKSKADLQSVKDAFPDIEFMYVYQIREDGCHVVFDTDTENVKGASLGEIIPVADAFLDSYKLLLAGRNIDPIENHGQYGWMLTVYRPIYSTHGDCVAYSAADISMDNIMLDRYVFIIKVISLLFGATIVLIFAAIWLAENEIITPINKLKQCAEHLSYRTAGEREKSIEEVNALGIKTGDEVESLYKVLITSTKMTSEYIETINNLQDNTILEFAELVENRDENTGEHIKRTAQIVKNIALQMRHDKTLSISDEEIEMMVKAAPLHDVGKIKIADSILNKPGRLTKEEFEIMKTHSTAGAEILDRLMKRTQGLDYLKVARTMALYHHEKWDGSGYPYGISGDAIPVCARIMAVADVYDALISKRSYKQAFSHEQAKKIIENDSGTHFDPSIVNAFLNAADEL